MDGLVPASKRRRVAAAIIDLIDIPILLGVAIGLLLLPVADVVRGVVLIVVNVIWLVFRDAVFSPARWLVDVKLVSLTGAKVSWLQALIRNIFLIVPFALVTGYACEIVRLLISASLLWRRILYAVFAVTVLVLSIAAINGGGIAVLGLLLALVPPAVFLVFDKEQQSAGRLADLWAKTQVVEA